MKLLRETVRRIILESGMKIMDDFPFDDTIIVIKRETYGYSIYYADENNPQQPTNHPKGYMEIAAPNGDTGPCDKAYHVRQVKTEEGWGPLLYDVAMEHATKVGGGLTSDRYYVSEEAYEVWNYYMNKRAASNDVTVHQLDDLYNTLTHEDTDNCEHDNVATDLMGDTDFESPLTKRYTKTPITLRNLGNKLVML